MNPTVRADGTLDALNDAIANENDRLVAELLADLAEINRELVAEGFESFLAVPAEWGTMTDATDAG